jgi:hypothetical protein
MSQGGSNSQAYNEVEADYILSSSQPQASRLTYNQRIEYGLEPKPILSFDDGKPRLQQPLTRENLNSTYLTQGANMLLSNAKAEKEQEDRLNTIQATEFYNAQQAGYITKGMSDVEQQSAIKRYRGDRVKSYKQDIVSLNLPSDLELKRQKLSDYDTKIAKMDIDFKEKNKDNYSNVTNSYYFLSEEANNELNSINALKEQRNLYYESELKPYEDGLLSINSKYQDDVELDKIKKQAFDYAATKQGYLEKIYERDYDEVLWFRPQNEKIYSNLKKNENQLSMITGQDYVSEYSDFKKAGEYYKDVTKNSIFTPDKPKDWSEAISMPITYLPGVIGKAISKTEPLTRMGSRLVFNNQLGENIITGIRTGYTKIKDSAIKANSDIIADFVPEQYKPAAMYGVDTIGYGTSSALEYVGSGVGANPLGAAALVASSSLYAPKALAYIPLSKAAFEIGTKVTTDVISGISVQESLDMDYNKLGKMRAEAVMAEDSSIMSQKVTGIAVADNILNAVKDVPFLGVLRGDKKAYKDKIMSFDLKDSEKKWLESSRLPARFTRDTINVAVFGEVLSELKGRTLYSQSVSKKPLTISSLKSAKGSFGKSFKSGYNVVKRVAPYEVMSTYTTQSAYYGEEFKPGELAAVNVVGSEMAGVIGGTLIGLQGSEIAYGSLGKTKKAKIFNYLGEATKYSVNLGEMGAENIGDFLANRFDDIFKPRRSVIGTTTKGVKIYNPISVKTNVKVNTKTSLPTLNIIESESKSNFKTDSSANTLLNTNIKSNTNTQTTTNLLSSINTNTNTQTTTSSEIKTNLPTQTNIKVNSNIFAPTKTSTQNNIIAKSELNLLSALQSEIKTPTETTTNTQTQVPVNIVVADKPPFPVFPIPKPKLNFGENLGYNQGSRKTIKTKYTASFDAVISGKFTSKAPTKSIYSGDETRAIYDPTYRKGQKRGFSPFGVNKKSKGLVF